MQSTEQLAAPISEESPAGRDLSAESSAVGLHWRISDARDRAQEAVDPDEADSKIVQWQELAGLCEEALATESKSTYYAGLLTEARTAIDGFAGFASGAEVAIAILRAFGRDCYPRDEYDEDEYPGETTVLPLVQLQTRSLLAMLRQVPLTGSAAGGPYSLWHWSEASRLASASDSERQASVARGMPADDTVRESAAGTPVEQLAATKDAIETAIERSQELAEAVNDTVGRRVASYRQLEEIFAETLAALRSLAGDRLDAADAGGEMTVAADGEANGEANGMVVAGVAPGTVAQPAVQVGAIGSREDAFRVLGDVATYFEKTEPQSLLPAQIRRVVKWGRMDPGELYREIISDGDTLRQLSRLVGIDIPKDDDD